jgi:hypothetical protein
MCPVCSMTAAMSVNTRETSRGHGRPAEMDTSYTHPKPSGVNVRTAATIVIDSPFISPETSGDSEAKRLESVRVKTVEREGRVSRVPGAFSAARAQRAMSE